ncbi:MAG TPA: undecaprenyl-phosphate glucose phosphotransferase [Stellaceae bacterium]|nr:undecaprenyl-phosphate glucose phosphotransferase [Stellaceae bacterium]
MATQRTAGLGAMTGPSSPNFAAGARLGDNGVRGAGFGNGPVRRGERLPAPLLRRVQLDGWRPRRIQSHVLVSLVQLADLLVMLIAGAASFAMQSRIVWPLPALPALMAALVLALMTRTSKPSLSSSSELMRQRFFEQFIDGAVYALAAFGFALVACVAVLQPDPAQRVPLVTWLLIWAVIALVGIMGVRLVLSLLLARWRAAGRLKQLVAIYGTGDLAERLAQRLGACADTIEIVGVFDDRAGRGVVGIALSRQSRGTTADLVELSRRFEIDRVIVALPHSAEKRLLEILRKLHKMPVEISLAPDMVGFNVPAKDPEAFGGVPLLDVYGRPLTYGQGFVKTIFDRLAAGVGMILLSPMLLAVALAIKLDSRGPVVFRQNRYGFGDRVIEVYKFRTMRAEAADPDGERQTEANDPRLTRIGGFLRRWSLDELPQLFNVLRGELSLVGPRPHAVSMHVRQRRNEDIVPDYALRHHVKPGITGWAQVNGYHGPVATERALRQRVAYDLDYIDRWSLWFDIRIILKTLLIAFGQRHAS